MRESSTYQAILDEGVWKGSIGHGWTRINTDENQDQGILKTDVVTLCLNDVAFLRF